MRIIGYERVSTARQGASGLGIEAQRQAIDGFVAQRGGTLLARFTEVESGRNPDRPELKQALHLAKVTGATLVIAKLDRLLPAPLGPPSLWRSIFRPLPDRLIARTVVWGWGKIMDRDDDEVARDLPDNRLFDLLGIVPILALVVCASAVWLL